MKKGSAFQQQGEFHPESPELWQMKPIGHMKSVFHFKNGTPRQPALCSHARGSVTINKSVFNNPEHSLEGLEQFSHVWVLFLFHKNNNAHTKAKVKPPRLDGRRVGVFSTRSPYRPNAIGLTLAAIDKINGATVYLTGIDILDGTPILDIKPYIPDYDTPGVMQNTDFDGLASGGVSDTADDDSDVHDDDDNLSQSSDKMYEDKDEHSIHNFSNGSKVGDQVSSENINVGGDKPSETLESIQTVNKTDNKKYERGRKNELVYGGNVQKEVPCSIDSAGETTPEGLSTAAITESTVSTNVSEKLSCSQSQKEMDKTIKTADWISHSSVRKLDVRFTPTAAEQLEKFSQESADIDYKLNLFGSAREVEAAVQQVLNEDPRSVYRRNRCRDSLYFFAIDNVHVTCWFDDGIAEVVKIQPVSVVPQCTNKET